MSTTTYSPRNAHEPNVDLHNRHLLLSIAPFTPFTLSFQGGFNVPFHRLAISVHVTEAEWGVSFDLPLIRLEVVSAISVAVRGEPAFVSMGKPAGWIRGGMTMNYVCNPQPGCLKSNWQQWAGNTKKKNSEEDDWKLGRQRNLWTFGTEPEDDTKRQHLETVKIVLINVTLVTTPLNLQLTLAV